MLFHIFSCYYRLFINIISNKGQAVNKYPSCQRKWVSYADWEGLPGYTRAGHQSMSPKRPVLWWVIQITRYKPMVVPRKPQETQHQLGCGLGYKQPAKGARDPKRRLGLRGWRKGGRKICDHDGRLNKTSQTGGEGKMSPCLWRYLVISQAEHKLKGPSLSSVLTTMNLKLRKVS